jgi:hypothetical protein
MRYKYKIKGNNVKTKMKLTPEQVEALKSLPGWDAFCKEADDEGAKAAEEAKAKRERMNLLSNHLYVFADFTMVEWTDELGGIELYSKRTLPERYNTLYEGAFRMDAFQFVALCEDPNILAYVRSDPTISRTTKVLLSGFSGKLDISNTKDGKEVYRLNALRRAEVER